MKRPTRECALVAPLLTAREGELSPEEASLRELHLAACGGCRARAADLAATEGLVREALLAEAARRDFAPFVDAVMERVQTGATARRDRALPSVRPEARGESGAADVAGRTTWLESFLGWARAHRAAAAASALAPTLAAAALIVYFSSSGAHIPLAGEVEVEAEGRAAVVLQTSEGPVVLLGDPEPDTGT
jgi:anti-sigma factor RsiW